MNVQAFLIMFREALEALLVVGILTTYLKKLGRPDYTKWVWTGVAGALVSSLLVAFLFQVVFTSFAMMGSEQYLKIAIMIISAILLTHMVLWLGEQMKDVRGETERKLAAILSVGSAWAMVVHAYLVVLREGVETVFFFAAISQGDISAALQSWGALLGILCAVAVCWVVFRSTMRFPLKTFFKVTSVFMMLIAAGLLAKAVRFMQDFGLIGSVMPEVFNLVTLLPEHPVDELHLIRDHGIEPLISAQVGIFLAGVFGYTHHPSLEVLVTYLGYYVVVFALLRAKRKRSKAESNKLAIGGVSDACRRATEATGNPSVTR
ncbi:MAG TPA: FTR1 family protein [Calditerricola sp.]